METKVFISRKNEVNWLAIYFFELIFPLLESFCNPFHKSMQVIIKVAGENTLLYSMKKEPRDNMIQNI